MKVISLKNILFLIIYTICDGTSISSPTSNISINTSPGATTSTPSSIIPSPTTPSITTPSITTFSTITSESTNYTAPLSTSTSIFTDTSSSSVPKIVLNYNNYCGISSSNMVSCSEPCPTGLNSECVTQGYTCIFAPNLCIYITSSPVIYSNTNYCGQTFNSLNCSSRCPLGLESECINPGDGCYNSAFAKA